MCTMLKFPDEEQRAERAIMKGQYPFGGTIHMCPNRSKNQTFLVTVWLFKDMKCPFCSTHPE